MASPYQAATAVATTGLAYPAQRHLEALCDGSLLMPYQSSATTVSLVRISNPSGTPTFTTLAQTFTITSSTNVLSDLFILNNGATTSDVWLAYADNSGLNAKLMVAHGTYTASGATWSWDNTGTSISVGSFTSAFYEPSIVWTGSNLMLASRIQPSNWTVGLTATTTKNGSGGWSALTELETTLTSASHCYPVLLHDAVNACTLLIYSMGGDTIYGRALPDTTSPTVTNWLAATRATFSGTVGVGAANLSAVLDTANQRVHLVYHNASVATNPQYNSATYTTTTLTPGTSFSADSGATTAAGCTVGLDSASPPNAYIFWSTAAPGSAADIKYVKLASPYASGNLGTVTNLTNATTNDNAMPHLPRQSAQSGFLPLIYAHTKSPWAIEYDNSITLAVTTHALGALSQARYATRIAALATADHAQYRTRISVAMSGARARFQTRTGLASEARHHFVGRAGQVARTQARSVTRAALVARSHGQYRTRIQALTSPAHARFASRLAALTVGARARFATRLAHSATTTMARYATRVSQRGATAHSHFLSRPALTTPTHARALTRIALLRAAPAQARFQTRLAALTTRAHARFLSRAALRSSGQARFAARLATLTSAAHSRFVTRVALVRAGARSHFQTRAGLTSSARNRFVLRALLDAATQARFRVRTSLTQLAAAAQARFLTRSPLTTPARGAFAARFAVRQGARSHFATRVQVAMQARARFALRFTARAAAQGRFLLRAVGATGAQARFRVNSALTSLAVVARTRVVARAALRTEGQGRYALRIPLMQRARSQFALRFQTAAHGQARFVSRFVAQARGVSHFLTRAALRTETRASFPTRIATLRQAAHARYAVRLQAATVARARFATRMAGLTSMAQAHATTRMALQAVTEARSRVFGAFVQAARVAFRLRALGQGWRGPDARSATTQRDAALVSMTEPDAPALATTAASVVSALTTTATTQSDAARETATQNDAADIAATQQQ